MEELLKALGPWPTVQGIAIGIIVAGVGIWAMRRGLQDKSRGDPPLEEKRQEWLAYKQLENIEQNSWKIAAALERQVEILTHLHETLNRIFDARWNRRQ
jgi:hypothetical protein